MIIPLLRRDCPWNCSNPDASAALRFGRTRRLAETHQHLVGRGRRAGRQRGVGPDGIVEIIQRFGRRGLSNRGGFSQVADRPAGEEILKYLSCLFVLLQLLLREPGIVGRVRGERSVLH